MNNYQQKGIKKMKVSVKKTSRELKGYKIDYTTNTLIMNYKFAEASGKYGTPEYKLLQSVKNDFPNIHISIQSGREQKTPRYNKRLTYENMETYIKCHEGSDVLMARFETVKEMSKTMRSPYKYVCDWFFEQFPNFKETPKFEGEPETPKVKVSPVNKLTKVSNF